MHDFCSSEGYGGPLLRSEVQSHQKPTGGRRPESIETIASLLPDHPIKLIAVLGRTVGG